MNMIWIVYICYSKWTIVVQRRLGNFQLYNDGNTLIFIEMMMRALCTRPTRLVGFL